MRKKPPEGGFFTCESDRTCVRITCDSNDIQRQSPAFPWPPLEEPLIGVDRLWWWSWGDSNPRPQAFFAQFYMFSDLI